TDDDVNAASHSTATKTDDSAATGVATSSNRERPPLAVAPFDEAQAKAHQEAWANYLGRPVVETNSLGMELVLIPPGEFLMGSPDSDPDAQDDEKPRHKVRITQPLLVAKTEVTQAQYRAVMGTNPSWFSIGGGGESK